MKCLVTKMWADEAGFVVSAELVLVMTISVLAMVVGLSEVRNGISEELEDVGSAFGALSQSYVYKGVSGHKGKVDGTCFHDGRDLCDGECDLACDSPIKGEQGNGHHSGKRD